MTELETFREWRYDRATGQFKIRFRAPNALWGPRAWLVTEVAIARELPSYFESQAALFDELQRQLGGPQRFPDIPIGLLQEAGARIGCLRRKS